VQIVNELHDRIIRAAECVTSEMPAIIRQETESLSMSYHYVCPY